MIRSILLFVIIIILLAGCSVFQRRDVPRETLLLNHLQNWRVFELNGIAEINVSHFRLRKNLYVNKSEDALRISLHDSGIFGLRPTPLLSIEIDSTMTMSLPEEIERMMGDIPSESDQVTGATLNRAIKWLEDNRRTIIRDKRIQQKDVELLFNDLMQIEQINIENDEHEVMFKLFYRRDDLNRIEFFIDNNRVLEIRVDRIKYS